MTDPFDLEKENFLAWYHNASKEDFALARKNNPEKLDKLMQLYSGEILSIWKSKAFEPPRDFGRFGCDGKYRFYHMDEVVSPRKEMNMGETINHPPHYQGNGLEVIDIIEAFGLGFHLGNAIKYILRAGKKTPDAREDIKKAQWYLDRFLIEEK